MGTRVRQSRSCVSLELKLGRRGILEPLTRRYQNWMMRTARRSRNQPATGLARTVQLSSYCTSRFSSDPNSIFRQHPTLPFFQPRRILSAAVNLPSCPAQVTVVFASMFHRKDFPPSSPEQTTTSNKAVRQNSDETVSFFPKSRPLLCEAFNSRAPGERYLSK